MIFTQIIWLIISPSPRYYEKHMRWLNMGTLWVLRFNRSLNTIRSYSYSFVCLFDSLILFGFKHRIEFVVRHLLMCCMHVLFMNGWQASWRWGPAGTDWWEHKQRMARRWRIVFCAAFIIICICIQGICNITMIKILSLFHHFVVNPITIQFIWL